MSDDPRSAATTDTPGVLSDEEVARIHAWWRAANYLSVGQIYLMDNPLLREPLLAEHVKPRLLGHWGTTPGTELHLRSPQPGDHGPIEHRQHIRTHGEDLPEIRDWQWNPHTGAESHAVKPVAEPV